MDFITLHTVMYLYSTSYGLSGINYVIDFITVSHRSFRWFPLYCRHDILS